MNLEDVNKLLDAGFSAAFIERILTPAATETTTVPAAPETTTAPAAPAGAAVPPPCSFPSRCRRGSPDSG